MSDRIPSRLGQRRCAIVGAVLDPTIASQVAKLDGCDLFEHHIPGSFVDHRDQHGRRQQFFVFVFLKRVYSIFLLLLKTCGLFIRGAICSELHPFLLPKERETVARIQKTERQTLPRYASMSLSHLNNKNSEAQLSRHSSLKRFQMDYLFKFGFLL